MKRITHLLLIAFSFAILSGCVSTGERGPGMKNTIMFSSGSAQVSMTGKIKLDKLAPTLKATPGNILVEGHTDAIGSPSSNRILSTKRAEAVKRELIKRKIDAKRIKTRGYSSKWQADRNAQTSAEQANNRRVIITPGQ